MRNVLLAACSLVLLAGEASAGMRVSYADPNRFTDADRAGGLMTAAGAAQSLSRLLTGLGTKLPPDRDITVEILDIDLAGRIAPERDPTGTRRVLDRSTWPRVRVAYVLHERGRRAERREELVSWQDYLQRSTARFAGDPLRFEKAMLTEWFEARFLR